MTENEALKVRIEEAIVDLDPRERKTLEQLGKKLRGASVTPETLAQMLPEALDESGEQRQAIASAMTPLTEDAIGLSVQKDPEILSGALFPVIGSAIRKAMAKMLAEMMANMNSGLESVFSVQRLVWRFESIKTGKPFLEIMLAHTMEYSIDHAFLIHKNTGLLLKSVSRAGCATADDDMVSSMLTAIRQYIGDSLQLAETSGVQGINTGDYTILVEEGPKASLALIIRGTPEPSVRTLMQHTLEAIHVRFAGALKSFRGDTLPFEKDTELLEACLSCKIRETKHKKPVFSIVFLMILALAAGFFGVKHALKTGQENRCIDAIDAETGIQLISTTRTFRTVKLSVLRDARARSLEQIIAEHGLQLDDFTISEEAFWSPHFSEPPAAPQRNIPEHLLEIARRLAAYNVYFEQDSGSLRDGQGQILMEAGELVSLLVEESKKESFTATVEITRHSAGSIQDEAGIRISEERANMALDAFIEINAPLVEYVSARGVGVAEPVVTEEKTEEDRIKNRSVTFKAVFQ